MTKLFLLANQPVPNQQQQDCRLVIEIRSPVQTDNASLQKAAEVEIKKNFDQALTFQPISEKAAVEYLSSDPTNTNGQLELNDATLIWHLPRIG
ncbi:MAG TPA: hypothetical protein VE860_02720 [Chthoniobacterales bacterium]|jgi:hypothetical protein|nr:hypothetical protein [Chthoniobacterales bacterium]